jgi:L-threonylcarbamoyladenylate synthase
MQSGMTFDKDIDQCLEVLHNGGLILYPTDTIWGIGCDATNEAAVEKIYQLKQRPGSKSMIVLLADEKELLTYVTQPGPQVFDYLKSAAKPTTVVYEGAVGLAANLVAADGTAGIRIVQDTFCRHLIKRFLKPIVSTSANIAGNPSPADFGDIDAEIKKGVDYIVQHRQQDISPAMPSSIVKWNNDGTLTIIRS